MLHFTRAGHGRPVVLVHGITENLTAFDPVSTLLADHYDVLAVDVRGHGQSAREAPYDLLTMASDVHDVVAHLQLVDPLLVGHSLGGTIVSAYGAMFPTRGVINIDQSLALGSFKEQLSLAEGALRGSEEEFQAAISFIFELMRGAVPEHEWRRVSALRHAEQDVVLGVWSLIFEASVEELTATVEEVARALRVPYLSLHGSDPGAPYAPWLTGLVPTTVVELWPNLGHYPHLCDPERFAERVRVFDDTST